MLLSAVVPLATWESLQADAYAFDRTLTSEANEAIPSICLHSWVVRVETVDARGKIRQATQSACDEGLAVRYGFKIARAAVSSLPSCALLDPDKTRNDVTRLAECAILAGDRAAAAQAFNAYHTTWFANPRGPDFARALQYMFYDRAELSWPGQPAVVGSEDAAKVWATYAGSNPFFATRIYGETADRVRIEGSILMDARQPDALRTRVPATMTWTRENGFGFRLKSLSSASPTRK